MRRAPRAGSDHPTLLDTPAGSAALPRTLAPMRPRLAEEGFNSPDHLFELKWDGIRALASDDRAGLRIVDRNGGDLLPAVPELRTLRLPEGTLLDGEIIVCDSRGRPNYDLLVGRLGPKASKRGKGPCPAPAARTGSSASCRRARTSSSAGSCWTSDEARGPCSAGG